jgi:hypothetical protein
MLGSAQLFKVPEPGSGPGRNLAPGPRFRNSTSSMTMPIFSRIGQRDFPHAFSAMSFDNKNIII